MNITEAELKRQRESYLNRKKHTNNIFLYSSDNFHDNSQKQQSKSKKIPDCFVQTEYIKFRLLDILDYTQAIVNLDERINETPGLQFNLSQLHQQRINIENTIFRVGVFGYFGVGKSTLINRMLMEENLLPVDEDRCTTAYTVIQRPDKENKAGSIQIAWHPLLHLVDELQNCLNDFGFDLPSRNERDLQNLPFWLAKQERILTETLQQMELIDEYEISDSKKRYNLQKSQALLKALPLHEYIRHTYKNIAVSAVNSLMHNPLAVPLIHSLTFYHDHEFLRHIQIIDSPGTGSVNLQDTYTAMELLELTDAIMFMTDARAPFTQSDEKQLLQWLSRLYEKNDMNNLFIIVNKTDLSEKSISDIQTVVQKRLEKDFHGKLKPKQIFCISCETDYYVELFLTEFYQFLKCEKYQILLQGTLEKSRKAFMSFLTELNIQFYSSTEQINNISQKIEKIVMDKNKLSTRIYGWLTDYDIVRFEIEQQIEESLRGSFHYHIHSKNFKDHLVHVQTYYQEDEKVEIALKRLSEEFMQKVIDTTVEYLEEQFISKIQYCDRELMCRFEKALQEEQKFLRIPDSKIHSLSANKITIDKYGIDESKYAKVTNNSDLSDFIRGGIIGATFGLSLIAEAGFKVIRNKFFKKNPESEANTLIQQLDIAFYHGKLEGDKKESSICLMLSDKIKDRIKSKMEQIKLDRENALKRIIDSINKDLKEKHSQRLHEETKKNTLHSNIELLWRELEFIKNEYDDLQALCR